MGQCLGCHRGRRKPYNCGRWRARNEVDGSDVRVHNAPVGATGRTITSCDWLEAIGDRPQVADERRVTSAAARGESVEEDGERLCREVAAVPRPGWTARLEAGLFEVRARISLSDAHSLQVRDFYYDGRRHGQEVYIALSSGPINAQNAILVSINLRCFAGQCLEGHPCEQTEGTCSDADFDLPLPIGLMYDQFDRASIVGMPQGVAWSEAEFRP